jgi:hypothetical protein
MTRIEAHAAAVDRVIRRLTRAGCLVTRIHEPGGVELAVVGHDGRARTCAIRIAREWSRWYRIPYGRKRYWYQYQGAHFNLHQAGKRRAQPTVWVLIAERATYLVPNTVIGPTRLTYAMHVSTRPDRPRDGHLSEYRNRWDLLTGLETERAA